MKENELNSSKEFGARAFGRHALIYSVGQGLLLVFGFVQFLIIPKYLSVTDYGFWQLYILYCTYTGLSHFGFSDGVLVRWAGKTIDQIKDEIGIAFTFILFEQLVVTIIVTTIIYFVMTPPIRDIAMFVIAFAFIQNVANFFVFIAQAVRRFGLLTVVHVSKGLVFIIFVLVYLFIGFFDYRFIIGAEIFSFFMQLSILFIVFRRYLIYKNVNFKNIWNYAKENIKVGIFVLLGNFVVLMFLTIDRLMVSSHFIIERFAIYAFALTMVNVIYTFIKAIAQVFFPYLSDTSHQLRQMLYNRIEIIVIIAWAFVMAGYFLMIGIVEYYLPHYIESLSIMKILLCTIGFGSIIRILHVNYLKVYRKQQQYFFFGVISLLLAVLLNLLAIRLWGTLESIAIATVISSGIWYVLNVWSLKSVIKDKVANSIRQIIAILFYIAAFLLTSLLDFSFIIQLLIYLFVASSITFVLYRNLIGDLIKMTKDILKRN